MILPDFRIGKVDTSLKLPAPSNTRRSRMCEPPGS